MIALFIICWLILGFCGWFKGVKYVGSIDPIDLLVLPVMMALGFFGLVIIILIFRPDEPIYTFKK